MNEWNIQSRAHACEACGQPFADQQAYRTLLFDQPPDLRRSDICEPCAQKDGEARSRTGFISHWQGIYEAPAPVVDAIQKETAETVLRKLIEQNNPRYAPAAFILNRAASRKQFPISNRSRSRRKNSASPTSASNSRRASTPPGGWRTPRNL